jgi:hypothetical protein
VKTSTDKSRATVRIIVVILFPRREHLSPTRQLVPVAPNATQVGTYAGMLRDTALEKHIPRKANVLAPRNHRTAHLQIPERRAAMFLWIGNGERMHSHRGLGRMGRSPRKCRLERWGSVLAPPAPGILSSHVGAAISSCTGLTAHVARRATSRFGLLARLRGRVIGRVRATNRCVTADSMQRALGRGWQCLAPSAEFDAIPSPKQLSDS